MSPPYLEKCFLSSAKPQFTPGGEISAIEIEYHDKSGALSEILVYRELRGLKIRQKRFLKQFTGKTIKNRLKLNVDIAALTGATISSRAITNVVREILAYLYILLPLETINQPN